MSLCLPVAMCSCSTLDPLGERWCSGAGSGEAEYFPIHLCANVIFKKLPPTFCSNGMCFCCYFSHQPVHSGSSVSSSISI